MKYCKCKLSWANYKDGVWYCRDCNLPKKTKKFDPEKIATLGFGGACTRESWSVTKSK